MSESRNSTFAEEVKVKISIFSRLVYKLFLCYLKHRISPGFLDGRIGSFQTETDPPQTVSI